MKEEPKQRDTKQRRLIYETVMQHCDHPDADSIYMDVHAKDSKISKATVYRNLKLLAENGDIMQVKVPGADRFDKTLVCHYHIICSVCGAVVDAPIEYIAENDLKVEEETGFKIERHRTVFEGICPECQKNISHNIKK